MPLYAAYNVALPTTTNTAAGALYATGGKVAVQLATPSSIKLRIVEWGISFNGQAAGLPAVCELVQNGTASTMTTAHSTTTIQPIGDATDACPLTMGTTTSGYGTGAITSATPDKVFDLQYVGPTSQYVKQWPLGREPVVTPSKFCQLRVSTGGTLSALAYIVFEI